jgi:hypothetical protein
MRQPTDYVMQYYASDYVRRGLLVFAPPEVASRVRIGQRQMSQRLEKISFVFRSSHSPMF